MKIIEIPAEENERLSLDSATSYRALAARANYLAQDRADVTHASNARCSDCSSPSTRSWQRVTRLVRFVKHAPRLVYKYAWQTTSDVMKACVDSDFADCRVTRRSTSGGVLMHGRHRIRHWSATQPTIALSSGDAGVGGMCKGASQLIGVQSISTYREFPFKLPMATDATAARGVSR